MGNSDGSMAFTSIELKMLFTDNVSALSGAEIKHFFINGSGWLSA
jgi:hypothetical protein